MAVEIMINCGLKFKWLKKRYEFLFRCSIYHRFIYKPLLQKYTFELSICIKFYTITVKNSVISFFHNSLCILGSNSVFAKH